MLNELILKLNDAIERNDALAAIHFSGLLVREKHLVQKEVK